MAKQTKKAISKEAQIKEALKERHAAEKVYVAAIKKHKDLVRKK